MRKINKTTLKKKDDRYLYCEKCGEKIITGQGWTHTAKDDKDFHLKCYLGKDGVSK